MTVNPTPGFQKNIPSVLLQCIAGTDAGKVISVPANHQLSIGRSNQNDLVVSDPYVADYHVVIRHNGVQVSFRTYPGIQVYVGSMPLSNGFLTIGQDDFRLGQSVWRLIYQPYNTKNWLNSWLGLQQLDAEFSLKTIFSAIWEKRTDDELENSLVRGTTSTTPAVKAISSTWPKPWLFARVGVFSLAAFAGLYFGVLHYQNTNLIPGMLVVGSFIMPAACLLFFWEINAPQNISIYQTVKLLLMGGIISLLVSIFLFNNFNILDWLGASAAGIIEEAGKLTAVLLLMRHKTRYSWTFNGLLLGAAVGTGFAAFESAGYAFRSLFSEGAYEDVVNLAVENIILRGLLSPFAHTIWTAIATAAVWRIKGSNSFSWNLLVRAEFLRLFLVSISLHMLWNSPFNLPVLPFIFGFFPTKYLVLGFVGWVIVFSLIQESLQQVKNTQKFAPI